MGFLNTHLLMMGRRKNNSSTVKDVIQKWQDDPSDTNLADLLSGAATKTLIREKLSGVSKPVSNGTLKPTNEKSLKPKGQKRKKSKIVTKHSEDNEGETEHSEDNTEHFEDDDGGINMVAQNINGAVVYVARLEDLPPLDSDYETSSDESDDFILAADVYQNGSRT